MSGLIEYGWISISTSAFNLSQYHVMELLENSAIHRMRVKKANNIQY